VFARFPVPAGVSAGVRVAALLWGRDAAERVAASSGDDDSGCIHATAERERPAAGSAFDLVVATDVMYIHEAVQPLVDTLQARHTVKCPHISSLVR
jgi:hypothetical protein